MTGHIQPNHRRDRQHTRRILGDLRVRFRDLTRSSIQEIDPLDHQRRLLVFPYAAVNDGRH